MTENTADWREVKEPRAVFDRPAPWVNRFRALVIGNAIVRLAFLEEAVGIEETSARAAVMMSAADARGLAEMLLQLLPDQAEGEPKVG